jgi:branched-chain amino acid transport system ATP-binding protein
LMVERLFELILSLVSKKRIAVLLVEQNVADALAMARRGYIMERGRVVKSDTGPALLADADVQRAYLGL